MGFGPTNLSFLKGASARSIVFCSLWGWVALNFSRPMFWLWNGLVFWFRLFFCLRWDGESDFFAGKLCWMGGMGMSSFLVCLIAFVLFVWVWGAMNCTLHCGLWIGLLFWFGIFFGCCLCVGRGFASHSQHGCYVELCGCECGGM